MTYTCIGKRKGEHGAPFQCTSTSDTPSNLARPEWGFLCVECSSTRYGRAPLQVETLDADKPNSLEFEPCELLHGRATAQVDETEQDELDHLEELDLG